MTMNDVMVEQVFTNGRAALLREDADAPIYLRAMGQAQAARHARWATYALPVVPPLASFADYAAAADKRRKLAEERSAANSELSAATATISAGLAQRDLKIERQVDAVLSGRSAQAFQGFEDLRAKAERLIERGEVFDAAVRRQDEVIAGIRSERSIDAAEMMGVAHRAAVADIADAIARLRDACDREEAARTLVVEAGYDSRLPNMGLPGRPTLTLIDQQTGAGFLDSVERRAREYVD